MLSRQTWTALVSAIAFVVLAMTMALSPVPFVVYSPGKAYDVLGTDKDGKPLMSVEGIQVFEDPGKLHMTTVSITRSDSVTSLPEAVMAYWLPNRDVLPRDSVYEKGKSADQQRTEERQMMDTSQSDAVAAALREAKQPVEELPVITSVMVTGPANGQLQPGDLILKVDDQRVKTSEDVRRTIQTRMAGDPVRFTVVRERVEKQVSLTTVPASDDVKRPAAGVTVGTGYRYSPKVSFGVSQSIGGPSAGLIFALALYDRITPEQLLAGRSVAGTGTITPNGEVGRIGGIQEKIAGAEEAGAKVFLVPGGNCKDLAGVHTKMDLIKVDTLGDAVTGLRHSQDPANAHLVPRCQ